MVMGCVDRACVVGGITEYVSWVVLRDVCTCGVWVVVCCMYKYVCCASDVLWKMYVKL